MLMVELTHIHIQIGKECMFRWLLYTGIFVDRSLHPIHAMAHHASGARAVDLHGCFLLVLMAAEKSKTHELIIKIMLLHMHIEQPIRQRNACYPPWLCNQTHMRIQPKYS